MKYSKEYIENLLGKFVNGLTTEEEELVLAEYFEKAEGVPAEWQFYRDMFRSFKTNDYDFSDDELDAMFSQYLATDSDSDLPAEQPVQKCSVRLWRWVSVAACACVLMVAATWSWTTSNDKAPVAEKMVAENQTEAVGDDEPEVNVCKTQEPDMREMSAKENEGNDIKPVAEQCLVANRNIIRKANVKNRVDDILASVTFPDEQVESYEIRKVGEANIVTKRYDDGTSMAFIVSSNDDESGSRLVALN